MSRRAQENLIAVLLLGVFASVIWASLDFGPRARMIPLPLAVFGIVLTLIQIAWQNLRSTDELHMDILTVDSPGSPPGAGEGAAPRRKPVTWRQEAGAFGIVTALLGLIFTVGIMPAVFLFTCGYFRATRQYSWRASLLYTGMLTVAVYLLFGVALQVQPYHGLLEPLVERFR